MEGVRRLAGPSWAAARISPTLPAEPLDLTRYLVDQAAACRIGALTRRLSAIAKAHQLAGHGDPTDNPAVREVLRGLRREHGSARRGAPPLWTSDLEGIIAATCDVPDSRWGTGQGTAELRDRAMLLLAFTSALRRSELVASTADLEPGPAGLIVHVRRSKTDTAGEGAYVGIRTPRDRSCARCLPSRPGSSGSPPSCRRYPPMIRPPSGRSVVGWPCGAAYIGGARRRASRC